MKHFRISLILGFFFKWSVTGAFTLLKNSSNTDFKNHVTSAKQQLIIHNYSVVKDLYSVYYVMIFILNKCQFLLFLAFKSIFINASVKKKLFSFKTVKLH